MTGILKIWNGTEYVAIPSIKGDAGKDAIVGMTQKTLLSGSWVNNKQSVNVSGLTPEDNIMVSPTPASFSAYGQNGIYASAQGANTLTFTCGIAPATNVDVNILILN